MKRPNLTAAILCLVLIFGVGTAGTASAQSAASPAPDNAAAEVIRDTFGDWEVRCDARNASDCFMILTGTDSNGNPMVEMSLVKFPPGNVAVAGATAVVPLGTALPEGLVLQVDEGDRLLFIYDFCTPAGCVANLALTADQVWAMKAGFQAAVTIASAARPNQPITVVLSLRGFTDAYNSLIQPN